MNLEEFLFAPNPVAQSYGRLLATDAPKLEREWIKGEAVRKDGVPTLTSAYLNHSINILAQIIDSFYDEDGHDEIADKFGAMVTEGLKELLSKYAEVDDA